MRRRAGQARKFRARMPMGKYATLNRVIGKHATLDRVIDFQQDGRLFWGSGWFEAASQPQGWLKLPGGSFSLQH